MKFIDLTGQTFGKLTVIKRSGSNKSGNAQWECRCTCGNTVSRTGCHLLSGCSTHCGCSRKKRPKLAHYECETPEYQAWRDIIQRCTNPNNKHFKDYGGRGIDMYPEWRKSFYKFKTYIGEKPTPKHTIERIDNNQGYFPGNIKWATQQEQNNNHRRNRNITFDGKTMNLSQWAAFLGIKRSTLNGRIVNEGWPIEKALTQPCQQYNKMF